MGDHAGNTKRDLILIAGILLAALFIYLLLTARDRTKTEGSSVVIRVDGEMIAKYDLGQETSIPIDTKYGHNLLVIREGAAKMEEADCPDGYCMEQNAAKAAGDIIVCLPHRLVIEAVDAPSEAWTGSDGSSSPDGSGLETHTDVDGVKDDPEDVDAVAR